MPPPDPKTKPVAPSLYALRTAHETDYEFLVALDVAAMRRYVEATWGFSYATQRDYIRHSFVPEKSHIIVVDGVDAGYLYVVRTELAFTVVDIKLLPVFQGRGIGTAILKGVLIEAQAAKVPTLLSVLKVNPARRLYERLGLRVFGENASDFLMTSRPKEP